MQTAKEAREARRKRILERGSDRLAYITGDTKHSIKPDLSTYSPPETSTISPNQDGIERVLEDQDVQPEGFELPARFTERAGDIQEISSTALPSITTLSTTQLSDTSQAFAAVSSNSSTRTDGVNARKKLHSAHVRNLVQSIDASEGIRALMAVIVAIAIVLQTLLSCCGSHWGSALSVWLPHWPISLVFLTDFSMVGAFIIRLHHNYPRKEMSTNESQGLHGSFDKFSKALDVVEHFEDLFNIGMLFKKAAGAISLDCSIYAVTLVCGLSLGQYWLSCCGDV